MFDGICIYKSALYNAVRKNVLQHASQKERGPMKKLIVTVCNGNIHRSVIAAACIRDMIDNRNLKARYEVLSRGLQGTMGTDASKHRNLRDYPVEWPLTAPVLSELDIEIAIDQQATPITLSVVERASLILAMDRLVLSRKRNSLLNQFPDLRSKMLLFRQIAGKIEDVPDTGGVTDPVVHRQAVYMIYTTIRSHFDELLRLVESPR